MVRQLTTRALDVNFLTQREQHKVKGKQKQKVILIISGVAFVYYPRSITDKENHPSETDTDATDKRITKKKKKWKRRENLLPPKTWKVILKLKRLLAC